MGKALRFGYNPLFIKFESSRKGERWIITTKLQPKRTRTGVMKTILKQEI